MDRSKKIIHWHHSVLNSANASGTLEFNVKSEDINGFYPIRVSFTSKHLFCDVQVNPVSGQGESLEFSAEKALSVQDYTIA